MRRLIYIKPHRAPRLNKTAELDYGYEFLNRRVLSVKLIQKFIDSEALTESEASVVQGVVYSAVDDLETDFSQLWVSCHQSPLLGVCTRVYTMTLLTLQEAAAVLEYPDNLKRAELSKRLSAVLGYVLKVALGSAFWKVRRFQRNVEVASKPVFNYRRCLTRRKTSLTLWRSSRKAPIPVAHLTPGRVRRAFSQVNSPYGFAFLRNSGHANVWLRVFKKSKPASNFLNKGAMTTKRAKFALGARVPARSTLAEHWTARQYLNVNGHNSLIGNFVNTQNNRPSVSAIASPILRSANLATTTALTGLRLAVRPRKVFTRPWRVSNFEARRFLGKVRLLNIKHNTKIRKKAEKLRKRRSSRLLRFEEAMSDFFNRGVLGLTKRVFGNEQALVDQQQPLLLGKRHSALGFRWRFANGVFRLAFRQKKKYHIQRTAKIRQALIRRNTDRFFRLPAKLKNARTVLRKYLPIFGRFAKLNTKKVAMIVTSKLFLRDIFWQTGKLKRKFTYPTSLQYSTRRLFGFGSGLHPAQWTSARNFTTIESTSSSLAGGRTCGAGTGARLGLFKPHVAVSSVLNDGSEFKTPTAFYKHVIKQRLLRRWKIARAQSPAPTSVRGHACGHVVWAGANRTFFLKDPTLALRTSASAGLTLTTESSPIPLPVASVAYLRTAKRWRALIKSLSTAPKWERRKRALWRVRNRSPRSRRWRVGRLHLVGTRWCLQTNNFRPYSSNLAMTLLRRHRFVKSGLWRGVRRRFAGFWRHKVPKRSVIVMRERWFGVTKVSGASQLHPPKVPPAALVPHCAARRANWPAIFVLNSHFKAKRESALSNRHQHRKLLMRWRLANSIFLRRNLGLTEGPVFKGKFTTRRRFSYNGQAVNRFKRRLSRYTARRKYNKRGYFFQPRLARRGASRRRFSLMRHVRGWFDPKGAGIYKRKRFVRTARQVRSSKLRWLRTHEPRRVKYRRGVHVQKKTNQPMTRKHYGRGKNRRTSGNLWITWSRRRRPKLRFRKKNLTKRKLPPTGKFKHGRFVKVKKQRRGARSYRRRRQGDILRGVNTPLKFKLRAFNLLHKFHYLLRVVAHVNRLLGQGEKSQKFRRRLKRTMVPSWMWWFKRRKWHRYWKIALKKKYQKSRKIAGKARFLLSGRWKSWRFYRARRLHLSLRRNPASGFWWRAAKRWPGRRGMSAAVRRMWRMLQNRKTTKRVRRSVLLSWYFDEFNNTSRFLRGRPVLTAQELTERFQEWHSSAQSSGFFKNSLFGKVRKPISETRFIKSVKPWGRACRFKRIRATAPSLRS